ncbi:MAG: Fic family protein [Bryobacterales bacterium]|nr:Fic family protein [Bryobacterales bacterium]
MPDINEKLAESLTALRGLQRGGRRVFESSQLASAHRERLLENGFLQEAMKGWLISSSPSARDGDSTPWYASFWEFCARYCAARFGARWHLSPEQSLLLHAENTVIPSQVIVHSPDGSNNKIGLLFGTSLFDLKEAKLPPKTHLTERDGLRIYTVSSALIGVPASFFETYPVETRVVLSAVSDAGDLLRHLLEGGHSVVAGRLAGAFRRIGRVELADEVSSTMKAAGYDVREKDPYSPDPAAVTAAVPAYLPPIVGRMQAMWSAMRGAVVELFPAGPRRPRSLASYLRLVDSTYATDAYHSLSIEGYNVSPELIDRVQTGHWNPDHHDEDRRNRDALAARGYWQAFQAVKGDVAHIVAGAEAAPTVRQSHRGWYRELFQPCVAAGLLPATALAGYRNDAVYLRTSRYVPPRWEAVRDAMPAFFELLAAEPHAGVRAVLGHWLFGYIHPYPDGNGRMARFLMNTMLASGGYPWTVIRVEDRVAYLTALDSASVQQDIRPFARFVGERVARTMQEQKGKR